MERTKLNHLPLEPYKARYTEMLQDWEQREFGKNFNVTRILPPDSLNWASMNIQSGEVLDSVTRPAYALLQMQELIKQSPAIGTTWFSDFFTPGLEALPYTRSHFKAYSFLWAQTFDRFDFTNQFISWMRAWEVMAFSIYSGVFVASSLLKELIVAAMPHIENKVHVVGLPFDHRSVFSRGGSISQVREFDCVFSSRFDTEKNPGFFLSLVDACPELKFAICTGHPQLKGTDHVAVRRAKQLKELGKLTIFENCSKAEYYQVLASSRVQFNCSSQDWVSFTLLEALTFGCFPLYPNMRSFPEALMYAPDFLYVPGSLDDAKLKLNALLDSSPDSNFDTYRYHILEDHSKTLERISTIIASEQ